MKARPVILLNHQWVECAINEATHVQLMIPSWGWPLTLPVILSGRREGTKCWSWNGNTEAPTLKPSILTTRGEGFRCHSWVNDGVATFLDDCSHELKGQSIPLGDFAAATAAGGE